MRKIDLRPYVARLARDHALQCPACGATFPPRSVVPALYNVQDSLVELCFVPAEHCKGRELLTRHALAEKIAAATDDVLVEDADWQRLVKAVDATAALGRNEVELVRRILDAPDVLVEEKPPASPSG